MQNDLESSSLRNCRVQNVSTDVIPETELMLQKETQVKRADRKVYLHLYLVWHIRIYIQIADTETSASVEGNRRKR